MKLHTVSDVFELMGTEIRLVGGNGWSSPIFKVISNYSATQCERTLFFHRNTTYLKRCREIQMFLFQRATVY